MDVFIVCMLLVLDLILCFLACTVLISLIDQLAEVNNETIVESFDSFCQKLPGNFVKPCQITSQLLGPLIVDM